MIVDARRGAWRWPGRVPPGIKMVAEVLTSPLTSYESCVGGTNSIINSSSIMKDFDAMAVKDVSMAIMAQVGSP